MKMKHSSRKAYSRRMKMLIRNGSAPHQNDNSDLLQMKKKTIFLYTSQGFAVRYLLRTDILNTLRESPIQVVILSHNGDEPIFREIFESENVRVEKFKNEAYESYLMKTSFQRILISLRAYVLNGKYDTRTVDDFRAIYKIQRGWTRENGYKGWIKGLIWELISSILKYSKVLRCLLIAFESRFFRPIFHDELFKKYSPDLVVVTSLCGFKYNEFFAREAHYFGVPVCCVVLSWDNTSGMGMPGYDPAYVISWSENMKKEITELNDIDEKKIYVGGVAHFDPYYNREIILEKEELFKKLGLNPNKKTIFFATKSPKRFPWGPELVAEIAEAIQSGKIKHPSQLLVRIHPLHYRASNGRLLFEKIIKEYEKVANTYPCVSLNIPETVSKKLDNDLADSETALVASVLKHSDVMLNMFSTMVIEAAIFQLPSINLCIRDKCKVEFGKSQQDIMVDYVQTHNQRIIQTGGVKTVFTMDELYDAINQYLDDPYFDAEKRELIKENEAGLFRGNAGKMIGRYLLSLVDL